MTIQEAAKLARECWFGPPLRTSFGLLVSEEVWDEKAPGFRVTYYMLAPTDDCYAVSGRASSVPSAITDALNNWEEMSRKAQERGVGVLVKRLEAMDAAALEADNDERERLAILGATGLPAVADGANAR